MVDAVANFAARCGTAFQLQDDILGIVGDEKKLGKPVGSDLREGKRTLVLHYAWQNADARQREKLLKVLGNQEAAEDEVQQAITLLRDLGGVEVVADRAKTMVAKARGYLADLPDSPYRGLLEEWASFLIQRQF